MRKSQGMGEDPPSVGGLLPSAEMPTINVIVQACSPDTLSQRNVEAITGIPARMYLELVRDAAFSIPVAKLGKLRVVNRRAFLAWLEERAAAPRGSSATITSAGAAPAKEEAEDPDAGAKRLLASFGYQLRPPASTTPEAARSARGSRRRA